MRCTARRTQASTLTCEWEFEGAAGRRPSNKTHMHTRLCLLPLFASSALVLLCSALVILVRLPSRNWCKTIIIFVTAFLHPLLRSIAQGLKLGR
jgi:hypothetical protein